MRTVHIHFSGGKSITVHNVQEVRAYTDTNHLGFVSSSGTETVINAHQFLYYEIVPQQSLPRDSLGAHAYHE